MANYIRGMLELGLYFVLGKKIKLISNGVDSAELEMVSDMRCVLTSEERAAHSKSRK